ncbi:hypothetical protein HYW17_05160 [Candidatus Uhrbacteria bacterium]|nr:hypothetical protein [Candidatus Uhrbacteria bacterium]
MANLRALKAISKVPIHVGPFVQSTTGALVPFFNDSRALYSHPKEFRVFVEELAKILKQYQLRNGPKAKKFHSSKYGTFFPPGGRGRRGIDLRGVDLIVGIPMAGIPMALALSLKTGIPFAYLNKGRKKTLRRRIVEGEYKTGARAVLVDDVIGFGGTILKAIRDCKSDGVIVKHTMTLWNPWWPKNRPFVEKLKRRGVTYDALYTRREWIAYLLKRGLVSREMYEIHQAFLEDPTGWHKDVLMWKKFLAWKRRYARTGKM